MTGAPSFGSLRLFPCRWPDQVSVNVVLAQELAAFLAMSSLGLVGSAQTVQSGARNVNPPGKLEFWIENCLFVAPTLRHHQSVSQSHPGTPAASRLLAMSTSQLHMSNCHF